MQKVAYGKQPLRTMKIGREGTCSQKSYPSRSAWQHVSPFTGARLLKAFELAGDSNM